MTLSGKEVTSPATQPLFPDTVEYLHLADNIRLGYGPVLGERRAEPDLIPRMPGYPVLLAGVQILFGRGLLAPRLVQALLGTAAAGLVYLLARQLFGEREALVAAAIVAVYPIFVLFTILVLSETLFNALVLGGLGCLALAYRRTDAGWAVAGGVVFGLATLVRASFLPFVVLAAAGWAAARRFQPAAAWRAGLMVVAFAAAMTPWVLRNWRVTGGHLVVTTLRAGASLYEGLNPRADGGPMMDRINWDEGTRGMSQLQRNEHWRRLGLDYAWEHPGRTVVLAAKKLFRFWNLVPNVAQFRIPVLCVALGAPYAMVMLLALVGLVRSWRRGDVALILLLPVVYYSLVHMIFVGSVRYRMPVMPLVIVLGAHGLVGLWSRWRRAADPRGRRSRKARVGHAE